MAHSHRGQTRDHVLRGRGISPGIGRGRAVLFPGASLEITSPRAPAADPKVELRRLESAIESARRELERVRLRVQADVGAENAEIFAAHEALLTDPGLLWGVRERLARDRVAAEQAVQEEVGDAAKRLATTDDPYLRERSVDIRDIGRRLLASLSSRQGDSISPLPPGSVLVAVELFPSDTVDLDRAHVSAIVTEAGGETSHVAILARALGIPAVTAIGEATRVIASGEWVEVDGDAGEVIISSTPPAAYASIPARHERPVAAGTACVTRDGERIALCANLGRADDAPEVRRYGLDGVGLFRTEFMFLDSREPPSFERQLRAYQRVIRALEGLPLAIRTLDFGGDKFPLFLAPHAERNPSLGLRGLRFSLRERHLLETQLHAIAQASAVGPVRVLFPMVLGDADLRDAKKRLRAAAEGVAGTARVEIGAMIETPAAVFLIDQILDEVDFVSLGTNDLTQFVLAADRDAIDLIDGYSVLHPSVLRAIVRVVEAARGRGCPVSVCGEAAGDPATAALLVGLGIRNLSMSPRRASGVRRVLSHIRCSDAAALASEALSCRTTHEVAERVAAFAKASRP
jgi:phosphotransferase system enzyme I (PtsI)